MEKEARKSVIFLNFVYHSPFSKGLALSVFPFISLEYTRTKDCITLGVLDLNTFNTTSCKIY